MRFFKTLSGFFETTAKQSQAGGNGGGLDSRITSPLGDAAKLGADGAAQRRDVVDEHLFVEALALTAFEIIYQDPQPSDAEKIILLMERLNHSAGPQKVHQAVGKTRFPGQSSGDPGDLLHYIRQSQPLFFETGPGSGGILRATDTPARRTSNLGPGQRASASEYGALADAGSAAQLRRDPSRGSLDALAASGRRAGSAYKKTAVGRSPFAGGGMPKSRARQAQPTASFDDVMKGLN